MKKNIKAKKTSYKKNVGLRLMLCIVAGLAAGGLAFNLMQDRQQFGSTARKYIPGKTYSNNNYDVRIDSVYRGSGEKGSLNPGDGKTYLIVNLYVKNKTNKILPLYPVTQTYIKDSQGQTYSIGPAIVKQPFLAGDLQPGDQIKGELAYVVPDTIQEPLFYFEGLSSSPLILKL
jgi:hypothetical protein